MREPKVFFFDEPLSNLDAKLRVQMRMELRHLHETLKVTSVYVTHDQVEAMTLGDRLVVINNGYAEQIGSPLEVYEKPATRLRGRIYRFTGHEPTPGARKQRWPPIGAAQ